LAHFTDDVDYFKKILDPSTSRFYKVFDNPGQLDVMKKLHEVWYEQNRKQVLSVTDELPEGEPAIRKDQRFSFIQNTMSAQAKLFI